MARFKIPEGQKPRATPQLVPSTKSWSPAVKLLSYSVKQSSSFSAPHLDPSSCCTVPVAALPGSPWRHLAASLKDLTLGLFLVYRLDIQCELTPLFQGTMLTRLPRTVLPGLSQDDSSGAAWRKLQV